MTVVRPSGSSFDCGKSNQNTVTLFTSQTWVFFFFCCCCKEISTNDFRVSKFWNQNCVLCVFFKGRHGKGEENLQVELVIFQCDAVLTRSFLKRNCKSFIHACSPSSKRKAFCALTRFCLVWLRRSAALLHVHNSVLLGAEIRRKPRSYSRDGYSTLL